LFVPAAEAWVAELLEELGVKSRPELRRPKVRVWLGDRSEKMGGGKTKE
jgi:hypothetical protein